MIRSLLIIVVLSLFALPVSARAQDACEVDAEKLCKDIAPGGGRIIACLKSHQSDLSPACKVNLAAAEAKFEQVKQACQPDAEKFCKGIAPGGGRIAACLKTRQGELSPACQKVFAKVETAVREVHEACKDDAEKLCQGIPPGGGRILVCLKSHEAELSGTCKAMLARKDRPAK